MKDSMMKLMWNCGGDCIITANMNEERTITKIVLSGSASDDKQIDEIISILNGAREYFANRRRLFDPYGVKKEDDSKKLRDGAPTVHDMLFKEGVKDNTFIENAKTAMMDIVNDENEAKGSEQPSVNTYVLDEINELKEKLEKLSQYVLRFETAALDKAQDEALKRESYEKKQENNIKARVMSAYNEYLNAEKDAVINAKKGQIKKDPSTFILMELEKQGAFDKLFSTENGKTKINDKNRFNEMVQKALDKLNNDNG